MKNLDAVLAPEEIHKHFVLEGSRLYRKLATGAVTQLKSMDGNLVVTIFNKQRLRGVDIAWCLIYGNWPRYPIVQLRDDPLNFAPNNLFPARLRALRYVQKPRGNLFVHSLSSLSHSSPERCRAHWEECAAEVYKKDLPYVLRVEEYERGLRAEYLRSMAQVRVPEPPKMDPKMKAAMKPSRPTAKPGREWHWWDNQWVDVPVACHVADDYRRRVVATLAGATWFQFDPEIQQVRAYMPDGTLWAPATE
jgi:hypothetical protein